MTNLEYTLNKYGKGFQINTIIEIIKNYNKYGELVIKFIDSTIYEYEPLKKIITIIKNYYNRYEKIPNLDNISDIINLSTDYNVVDREILIETIKVLKKRVKEVENGDRNNDSDYTRDEFKGWVQIQEQRKLGEYILNTLDDTNNDIKVEKIQERIKTMSSIFEDNEDFGISVFDSPEAVLDGTKEEIVPTFISEIDDDVLRRGGIPKGKLVGIVAPSGVGKSAMVCSIANSQANNGYSVLQIFFEESKTEYQKNHYAKWSNIDKEDFDTDNKQFILDKIYEHNSSEKFGSLYLKKCDDGDFTTTMLKKVVTDYKKRTGVALDSVFIDYFECMRLVTPTKDTFQDELKLVSELKRFAEDFNVVLFVCFQAKPEAKYNDIINATHVYGSFQKVKKADLLIGVGKNEKQQRMGNNTANISIIKSKMSSSGQIYLNSVFNNGTMEIVFSKETNIIEGDTRKFTKKKSSAIIDDDNLLFLTENKKVTMKDASTISLFENEKSIKNEDDEIHIKVKKENKVLSLEEEIKSNHAIKLMFQEDEE